MKTFHLSSLYKMSNKNARIYCQMLFDSSQLTWMNEIKYNSIDLQFLAYHFLINLLSVLRSIIQKALEVLYIHVFTILIILE